MISAEEMRQKYDQECVRRAEEAAANERKKQEMIEKSALQLKDQLVQEMVKKLKFPFYSSTARYDYSSRRVMTTHHTTRAYQFILVRVST